MRKAGFILGDQRSFELETESVMSGRFQGVKRLIDAGEAFQDVPFSYASEKFLVFLTSTYLNARFILNTRDRSDWYNSCDRFYRKILFHHNRKISWEDVDRINYHGGAVILKKFRMDRTRFAPFEKEPFLETFDRQKKNNKLEPFFTSRPNLRFLKTDFTKDDFNPEEVAKFLGIEEQIEFPHLNKSK